MMTEAQAVADAVHRWGDDWLTHCRAGRPPLYVGFSGGLDSTVLLHAALAFSRVHGCPLTALHVDHGVAARSQDWATHCERRCREWQVSFERLDVAMLGVVLETGPGFEERARASRYRLFAPFLAAPDSALLLAHHADDQAETALLRLVQGRGLVPMPARRPFRAGTIERPLLGLSRRQLESYASCEGLTGIDDPSNRQLDYDRNFLRHRVLPVLKARWPAVIEKLNRGASVAAAQADALALLLKDEQTLAVARFEGVTVDLGTVLLRAWLVGRGEFEATDRALAAFLDQLAAAPDQSPELRCATGVLRRQGESLQFDAAAVEAVPGLC